MDIQGTVLDIAEKESTETKYGKRDLIELKLNLDEEEVNLTLWGDWVKTTNNLTSGKELLVTNVKSSKFQGRKQYSTTENSYVIIEPSFLVDVTEIRSWVQCPRIHYLNKISGTPLKYPVVRGTIVHEVFGDILRGQNIETSVEKRVNDAKLEIGILEKNLDDVKKEIREHSKAIKDWLNQEKLVNKDKWRSEYTLISKNFGIKGRCDAIRQGSPIELKTGKNTEKEPRFQDKIQVASYALLLRENDMKDIDTGTVLYTGNSMLDRKEETGSLSICKKFSINEGLLKFIIRKRNEIVLAELDENIPTGYEADAICDYCFEQEHCMMVSGRLDQESKAGQIGESLPQEERDYFNTQYNFLQDERLAVHDEYKELWKNKKNSDRTLTKLDLIDSKKRDDGKWELRLSVGDKISKIQEGDLVIASEGNPTKGEMAWVEKINLDYLVVVTEEFINISRLDIYPSEFTVDRMLTSVYNFILKGDKSKKDIIFNRRKPEFEDKKELFIENNNLQNKAVNKALNAKHFALIHGPPGTGKTYTVTEIVKAFVEKDKRILLSALTNRAVDNILKSLRDEGFENFIRIGSEKRISDDLLDVRVDTDVEKFKEANVVAATAATCSSRLMREQEFDVGIIDEAGQLTEPETLSVINLSDKFVLVGDHKQLPSVTKTETRLTESLFERLIERNPEATVTLEKQYRMAQRIQSFPSHEFYNGNLRPANYEVASQDLTGLKNASVEDLPEYLRKQVLFIDTDGKQEGNINTKEAQKVAEIIKHFRDIGVSEEKIGVITPFRAQALEIGQYITDEIAVDTVDRFQGSSKEIIIISFVASEDLESPVFDDYRRLNVALTRAKKALILVGDSTVLEKDQLYKRMLEWTDFQ